MSTFLLPCISMIAVFWLGFGLTYFVLRGRVSMLESRIARVEKYIHGRQTDEFPRRPLPQPISPRPNVPRKYITVDRQPKPEYYR